eukprot:Gb_37366 [translate_table: standard]
MQIEANKTLESQIIGDFRNGSKEDLPEDLDKNPDEERNLEYTDNNIDDDEENDQEDTADSKEDSDKDTIGDFLKNKKGEAVHFRKRELHLAEVEVCPKETRTKKEALLTKLDRVYIATKQLDVKGNEMAICLHQMEEVEKAISILGQRFDEMVDDNVIIINEVETKQKIEDVNRRVEENKKKL